MPHPKVDPSPAISAAWQSKQHIILERTQMSRHLINHLYFAWASAGLESSLYSLYSFALFLVALVTEYNYPHASLNVGPQAVFQEKRKSSKQTASGSGSEATSASKSGSSPTNVSARLDASHVGESAIGSQQDAAPKGISGEGQVTGPSSIDGGPQSAPAGTADSSQSSASKKVQEKAPELGQKRTPDFARMFIPSKPPKHLQAEALSLPGDPPVPLVVIKDDIIIDAIEIKPLTGEQTVQLNDVGKEAAERALQRHLEQVYETALTALEHNDSWDTVSVILIIGFFFTQFVWTSATKPSKEKASVQSDASEPETASRADNGRSTLQVPNASRGQRRAVTPQPVPGFKPVPILSPFKPFVGDTELLASQVSKDNLNELLVDAKTHRAILRERPMPLIYHYNEPAFVLSEELGHKKTCTLTDSFIAALTTPLRHSKIIQEQVVIQPSWLDCNEAAIPTTHDVLNTDRIRVALRELQIEASYDQDDALVGEDVVVEKAKHLSPQDEEDEADYAPSDVEPEVPTDRAAVRRSTRRSEVPDRVPVSALEVLAKRAKIKAMRAMRAAEAEEESEEEVPSDRSGSPLGGIEWGGPSGSGN
ncbi:hypothetical protein OH76DRAFT_1409016 [Lentinus brumalis]|uniref:Uncharacterized protein n=1 Tax=Lentinus brumalis TaxID=2498619 RepID=A0A371CWE7_9APHY|nr:hypothetical protein OH76DRAFT_1409016 [Polyporus brumalis]